MTNRPPQIAPHNNDTSAARYNKAAADLAWSRTVALFKEALT